MSLKKPYCFISVFVLLLFFSSSCVFFKSEVNDSKNYVKQITESTLDVSDYNGKLLYFIKVNTDTSTTAGGYAKQGTTGSLANSKTEFFNNGKNVNIKSIDKSEPAPIHIPFKSPEILPFPESSLDKLNNKKYNQKGSSEGLPKTGNGFVIDNKEVSISTDSNHYYSGKHCDVWYYPDAHPYVTSNYSHIDSNVLKKIANRFDAIYEKETALLGDIYWLDNQDLSGGADSWGIYYVHPTEDTKIDIVIYDMNNYNYETWKGGTGGFFWGDDMFSQELVEAYNDYATSKGLPTIGPYNSRLMINVDSGFLEKSLTDGKEPYFTYSTLAHEFNHMLNYFNRQLKYGRSSGKSRIPDDVWFTEMLSAIVEGLFTEEIGYDYVHYSRIDEFLAYTYNGFTSWGENENNTTFPNASNCSYGPVYAFGSYLTRNFGGVDFVREIATSSLPSEEAIVEAVKKYGNRKDVTFEAILCEYPQVIINKDGKNEKLPTFKKTNKNTLSVGGKTYTYDVKAINIDDYLNGYEFNWCFKSTGDTSAMNSSGFTISKISKDHPQTLNFTLPTNNKVKMFVVVGDDE